MTAFKAVFPQLSYVLFKKQEKKANDKLSALLLLLLLLFVCLTDTNT